MPLDRSRREFIQSGTVIGSIALAGCGGVPLGEPADRTDSPPATEEDVEGDEAGSIETERTTPTATREETPTAVDTPIGLGSILPLSGALSSLGPGMQDAVELAVEHVNAAGGPLGRVIEFHPGDSETDQSAAVETYRQLVDAGTIGIVGAVLSGVSQPIAQQVAGDRVMQISPASSNPSLAGLGTVGGVDYFGRTAPDASHRAVAMARVMNSVIGANTAAFLHRESTFSETLARKTAEQFAGETLQLVPYPPDASDYTPTLDRVFEGDPTTIGFFGFPFESQPILQAWADGGYGGQWVLSEDLDSPAFLSDLSDIVEGMFIAAREPAETRGQSRFEDAYGEDPGPFTPHAYDAMFLMALAIQRAGEASGTAIAEHVRAVSRPPGEPVTVDEFDRAIDLLDGGSAIDYQGASGPVTLSAGNEVVVRYAISRIRADGSLSPVGTIPASFFEGKL